MFSLNRLTLTLGLMALAAATPAAAGIITLTNSSPANVDFDSVTRTFNVTSSTPGFGTGTITDVNIALDFMKADGEDPNTPGPNTPYFGEIVFRLTSPSGTSVQLIGAGDFNNGAAGTLFNGTIVFDQSAAMPVDVNPDLVQPGTFRPVSPLSILNGESAAGTFTLLVQDLDESDSLRFRSATLTITTADDMEPVPEPASIVLTIAGILGIAARRWHKRAQA